MTTQEEVAQTGQRVISRVVARRRELGLSARELAEGVTAAGFPLTRSTLANLESGRRGDITTTELVAFAIALRTTPMELLLAPACATCKDVPPVGFTCNACGRTLHPGGASGRRAA